MWVDIAYSNSLDCLLYQWHYGSSYVELLSHIRHIKKLNSKSFSLELTSGLPKGKEKNLPKNQENFITYIRSLSS